MGDDLVGGVREEGECGGEVEEEVGDVDVEFVEGG